jgi:cephalosporin hydroxylase
MCDVFMSWDNFNKTVTGEKKLELSRIMLIQEASLDDLKNAHYLEEVLIPKLGFNNEILHEQPQVVKDNCGGLLIWQYPNQFSKYLCLLQKHSISSYIEIGCRWGGTFILTTEYLKRFNNVEKSVAVDIISSPVEDYCDFNSETTFMKSNSQSEEFKDYMKNKFFDIIFIDGDHSYAGVKNDYEISKESGKIFVFHDIVNDECGGVVHFWNELKEKEKEKYDFFEFTEQYNDVWNTIHRKFLGIGVAIKK